MCKVLTLIKILSDPTYRRQVIARTEYEGEKADIWSCGVIAFVSVE